MAEILLREAVGAGDVAAVRRLLQSYGEYLAANPAGAANICIEGYAEEVDGLGDKYAGLLLAPGDGAGAGSVALRRIPTDGLAGEMKRLWGAGAFRGVGLGRRLVEKAIDWARQ